MLPAYMDTEIKKIYQQNFIGEYLDQTIIQERAYMGNSLKRNEAMNAEQAVLISGFRSCMLGEKTVDEAIAEIKQRLSKKY